MPLPRDIEQAAMAAGWDALYEEHFQPGELRAPNASGERSARSPFHFANDHHASFSLNCMTGLFVDFHTQAITGIKGGNYVQFIAMMMFFEQSSDGKFTFDWDAAERWVRARLGIGKLVDEGWLSTCQAAAAQEDARAHASWRGRKPWSVSTLRDLGVGWDERTGRLVFPLYDRKGALANCLMYQPGGEPKTFWLNSGMSGNFVFPYCARSEEWVVLVEGLPDATSLRSIGFNGVSGTMGSGQPLPGPPWWIGKNVFVWMDDDEAGRKASISASNELQRAGAAGVHVVSPMPHWDGKPSNADPSDWIAHMFRCGADLQSVQAAVRAHLISAPRAESPDSVWDSPPVDVKFVDIITSGNKSVRVRSRANALAVSANVYMQAVDNEYTCPAQGRRGCAQCSLATRWHGLANLHVDPRSELGLKMYGYTDAEVDAFLRAEFRIDARCPEPRRRVTSAVDVQQVVLAQTLDDATDGSAVVNDYAKIESVFLLRRGTKVNINTDYEIEAFVHPHPKSQRQILVVDSARRTVTSAETFGMTAEVADRLKVFRPGAYTTTARLGDVANDLAASITGILGRLDLHLMYRTVWHSATAFMFGGSLYKRGWIEAIVVGDTRCGKSAAFKALSKFYSTGILVDCKMQSAAGVLGAVETSSLTGERYVVPGIMPRQDKRGPICFDEFASKPWERRTMIETMSSTRAEGEVGIYKAASAVFPARVPGIWLCNPGMGRLMGDIGGFGVESISRLIQQPEDIARFDVAMAVSQDEVSIDMLNATIYSPDARYSQDDSRLLMSWLRSRKPEQIWFTAEAERAVIEVAAAMFTKYDASIPFVEPADQRHRVAKVAVSVATQLFSSSDDYEEIVVKPEHVLATAELFRMWYDKPSFGYDRYSVACRRDKVIVSEPAVADAITSRIKDGAHVVFAEKLLRMVAFSERTMTNLAPISWTDAHGLIQTLSANRCIEPDKVGHEMWVKTPQFTNFLNRYIAWCKAQADYQSIFANNGVAPTQGPA